MKRNRMTHLFFSLLALAAMLTGVLPAAAGREQSAAAPTTPRADWPELQYSDFLYLPIIYKNYIQTKTWGSSFTVVNLNDSDVTVLVTFYEESGNSYTPNPLVPGEVDNPFTVSARGSQIIVMAFASDILPDGQYGVRLSSDQPIEAMAIIAASQGLAQSTGAHLGTPEHTERATYLPTVAKNAGGNNSHLAIQNLTNAPMDITVSFHAGSSTPVHQELAQVPPYSPWYIDVSSLAGLPDGFNGAAVVRAAGPTAAVDNQLYGDTLMSYSGLPYGHTTLYVPLLYDQFYGWNSTLGVQNAGTATALVTVDYSDGSQDQQSLDSDADWQIAYGQGQHDTFFTAEVNATEPLVAVVTAMAGEQGLAYEAFLNGTGELFFPAVMKWFVGNFNTSIQIQNKGSTDALVTITYEGYEAESYDVTMPADATHIFYTPDETFLPSGYAGSATLSSTHPIVGLLRQTNDNPGSATGDFTIVYHGLFQREARVPGGTCDNPLPLSCGQQVSGDTSTYTNTLSSYSCSAWDESGPEVIYDFYVPNGFIYTVTATLISATADLDLFFLATDGCAAGQCLSPSSFGGISAAAVITHPGTYYLAVDGYMGTTGTYGLDLTCDVTLRPLWTLGDFVWEDLNRDGIQDIGEPGIDGVTVNLYNCTGGLFNSDITSGGGAYSFNGMEDDYYLEFTLSDGYTFTLQDQGIDDAVDSDADPATGQTVCTHLEWGEVDTTWDAGLTEPPCVPLGTVDIAIPSTITVNLPTTFTLSSVSPPTATTPFTITWDFSDGTVVQTTTHAVPHAVMHTYTATGNYTLTLLMENACSSLGPTIFPITVVSHYHIFLPIVTKGYHP